VIFEDPGGGLFPVGKELERTSCHATAAKMSRRPKTMDKAIVHGSVAFYLGKKVPTQPKL
jgi:hypothetical protein